MGVKFSFAIVSLIADYYSEPLEIEKNQGQKTLVLVKKVDFIIFNIDLVESLNE